MLAAAYEGKTVKQWLMDLAKLRLAEMEKKGILPKGKVTKQRGIVRLSEFDRKLGHTRIHHSLIVQHSGSWPEVETQPNLT